MQLNLCLVFSIVVTTIQTHLQCTDPTLLNTSPPFRRLYFSYNYQTNPAT